MSSKYFQIGYNKCGTASIARFFERNGIAAVHWDQGRLARRMHDNLQAGRFILAGYERYDAFADMEQVTAEGVLEGYKRFGEILKQVEGAMFILNTRDRDRWIRSRLAQVVAASGTPYAECFKAHYGVDEVEAVVECWKRDWDAHHAAVKALVPPERLLVFDIETDPSEKLCAFAGLQASAARHYTQGNFTKNVVGRVLCRWTPETLVGAVPLKVKDSIRELTRRHR